MADSLILEQLKTNRNNAKRQFIRLSNNVLRMHSVMSEEELKDSFKTLTIEANKVFEANEDVEDQYKQESEGAALSDQQRADLDKVSDESESKLTELKDLIVKTLWVKYGEDELSLAVEAAELEVKRVEAVSPSEDKEIFDFMIEHMGELVKKAKELHTQWKSWAPPEEQQQLQTRVRELERALMKLTARKAEFIKVRGRNKPSPSITKQTAAPATQTKSDSLPKCPGPRGDFYSWKKDWELLQRQGDPTGSGEVKKAQLLKSVDSKITQELQLSMCSTAEDILKTLEHHYGNKTNDTGEQAAVKGNTPRKIMELLQSLQKSYTDLNEPEEILRTLESKLPESMKKDWLQYAAEQNQEQGPDLQTLLTFLRSQEGTYEELDKLGEGDGAKVQQDPEQTNSAPECIICGHVKHGLRLYFCKKFQSLKLKEKKEAVKRLGACKKCLEIHSETDTCKKEFLCQKPDCSEDSHHYTLCPRTERPRTFTALKSTAPVGGVKPRSYPRVNSVGGVRPQVFTRINSVGGVRPQVYSRVNAMGRVRPQVGGDRPQMGGDIPHLGGDRPQVGGDKPRSYTKAQQEFVKKLPPELAKEFRQAFRSSATRTVQPTGAQGNRGFRAWTGHKF